MNALLAAAGVAHLILVGMNFFLPGRIDLHANFARLTPLVRQMAIVHHAYIVGILVGFAGLCFFFPADLASGRGLGRAIAAGIALFWTVRIPIQLFIYDKEQRRLNRGVDVLLLTLVTFMAAALWIAAAGGLQ
jgi:hypothetical protein